MWIQHFLFARTARVKLDGILSKKVCLREGVPQGGVLSPTLFLVYINDILTTLSKRVSNTLHADDLAIWNASEHTTTGAMKTTPVHDMEKKTTQPMWSHLRGKEVSKSSFREKKLRRLPSHPLHTNLAQPTKNRLKRQSLNHRYTELSRTHQDIVDVPAELLTDPAWKPDRETDIQMFLSIPGITSKEQLPGEFRNLMLALTADRFPHTAWTHVYTDGSAEEGMKNGGSGVYIRYSDGDTTSLSVPGGLQCSNYRAEILAISTAAEHLLESRKKMGNIAIFTDSLSTLQALNSSDPDQMIQGLHSSLAKLTAQFTVSLQWVPAHVGLTGNEKADRLAKIGSQAPQTQNPVTYREAKTLLHSRYNGDWKKYNGRYQAHLDPIWRMERAQQTTIFRLRTGHCGLSAHLKRTGISDTSLCECGQADQTPDHVLQSCPKYAQGADLTTKLWGSAEDLYRTADFVASTVLKI